MYNKPPPTSNKNLNKSYHKPPNQQPTSNKSYHKPPNQQPTLNKSYHKPPNQQQILKKNTALYCDNLHKNFQCYVTPTTDDTKEESEFDSSKLLDIVRSVDNENIVWDLTKISSITLPNTLIKGTLQFKENGDMPSINIIDLRDSINNLKLSVSALQLLVPSTEALADKTSYFLRADGTWNNVSQPTITSDDISEGENNLYYTDVKVSDHLESGNISNILLTGEITTKAVIVTSDKQTKENINDISDKNILEQMKPVEYNYKSDCTKRKRYGLVAQELEEIAPELVFTDNNNVKGVNYNDIIALLIKENQYMKQKLLQLEKEVFSN